MMLLTNRYENKILGVLSCFDRVVIQRILPKFCYAKGIAAYLSYKSIRIFDDPRFPDLLRDELGENAEWIASENGLEVELMGNKDFRKEKRIRKILKKRGHKPGLVHIFSAMKPCQTNKLRNDKQPHKTFLKLGNGKSLHYYFYLR